MTPPAFAGYHDKKQSASSASTLGADFFVVAFVVIELLVFDTT